jgi:hypothetical protein
MICRNAKDDKALGARVSTGPVIPIFPGFFSLPPQWHVFATSIRPRILPGFSSGAPRPPRSARGPKEENPRTQRGGFEDPKRKQREGIEEEASLNDVWSPGFRKTGDDEWLGRRDCPGTPKFVRECYINRLQVKKSRKIFDLLHLTPYLCTPKRKLGFDTCLSESE